MPNTYENIGKIEEARWRFFSGFCGGILSRTCIAPIERYIILRQTGSQTYLGKHWKEIAVIIYNKEGPSSFFKGNGANCMRVGPFQAMESTLFDTFHHYFVPHLQPYVDKHFCYLFFGAVSGAIATASVYPFDVTRTLLAVQTEENSKYKGIWGTIFRIVRKKGVQCLYKGLTASIIGVVPFASIKLTTKKVVNHNLHQHAPWLEDRARHILTGGVAGSTALTVVYPLDVIRRKQHIELLKKDSLNPSYWQIIRNIYQTNGLKGFYVGLVATYIKVFPSTAIFMLTYEQVKKFGHIH